MPTLSNQAVVSQLKELLVALQVSDGVQNAKTLSFQIRAYQNAISAIEGLTIAVEDLWKQNRLKEIPGVGATLEQHLKELFSTGKIAYFEELKKQLPQGMFGLLGLRGIGAKKAYKLASIFNLTSKETAVEELKLFAEQGKIRTLAGFGVKSEQEILEVISDLKLHKSEKVRMLLSVAEEIAQRICAYLLKNSYVKQAVALGSLRRKQETVGDLDIVATVDPAFHQPVLEYFLKYPEIDDVLVQGDKKVAVVLTNNVQVDLRVSEPDSFGAMVQYSTGSKHHNVLLRTYALGLGYSISEYGIKDLTKDGNHHTFASEEALYHFLKLAYIPPELRQGKNEIELAAKNKLPTLIELADIKGDFHTHTNFSDGVASHETMVQAAIALGYEYYGISDHSPSVVARDETEVKDLIAKQRRIITDLNSSQAKMRIYLGYEVNILATAQLSLPDNLLCELDYVVASIHTAFDQPKEQITKRLIAAIKNPYVKIIGHPSGRLINERKGCDLDWPLVFQAAKDYGKILEINSQPTRLDLPDDLITEALRAGVKLIINTDAHAPADFAYMKYGIYTARRGACEKTSVINTKSLKDFGKELQLTQ